MTGNEAADKVINQLAKKSAYAIPGVGKLVAAADAASLAPQIGQKGAQLALQAGGKLGDITGAATRGTVGALTQKDSVEKSFKPETIVQRAQGTKYAGVLQEAMQRGPEAVRAANFVLQGRDPEYRKLTIQDEDRQKNMRTDEEPGS